MKSLYVLGVAALIGVSGPASAVTLSYDLDLQYEGTTYFGLDVWTLDDTGSVAGTEFFATLSSKDDPIGLPRPLPSLVQGDIITFSGVFDTDTGSGSTRTVACSFGGMFCGTDDFASIERNDFSISEQDVAGYDYREISGGTQVGDSVEYALFDAANPFVLYEDAEVVAFVNYFAAEFTVVSSNIPSVPVPASIAFAPLGGLALVFLRWRQRRSRRTG